MSSFKRNFEPSCSRTSPVVAQLWCCTPNAQVHGARESLTLLSKRGRWRSNSTRVWSTSQICEVHILSRWLPRPVTSLGQAITTTKPNFVCVGSLYLQKQGRGIMRFAGFACICNKYAQNAVPSHMFVIHWLGYPYWWGLLTNACFVSLKNILLYTGRFPCKYKEVNKWLCSVSRKLFL